MRLIRNADYRPHIVALLCGAVLLSGVSVLRQAEQSLVQGSSVLASIATLLAFVIPGAVVGALARGAWLINGVLLGLYAGAFVTWQAAGFRPLAWNVPLLYETFAVLVGLGIVGCGAGAAVGRALSKQMFSSNRIERTRDE